MDFEPHQNVKAVKGLAIRHIQSAQKKGVHYKNITVTLNGNLLNDKDKLSDLNSGTTPLIVNYC